MKKGIIGSIIVVIAIIGAIITITCCEWVGVGKVGVVYNMRGGVQDEVLQQGLNFVSPTQKMKQFSIGNEQLILSEDSREGSPDPEAIDVATADDASIPVDFQISYRFREADVVVTYKRFKGMDGEQIINQRVKTVLKSRISEVTTNYSMMDIYSGNREKINREITEYLGNSLGTEYGIEVIDASIFDVHPDAKLQEAIDNRVNALQAKQQAEAEQDKARVEADTKRIQAEADANANAIISQSITPELIQMKEAEARLEHGWVTVQGADAVVTTP